MRQFSSKIYWRDSSNTIKLRSHHTTYLCSCRPLQTWTGVSDNFLTLNEKLSANIKISLHFRKHFVLWLYQVYLICQLATTKWLLVLAVMFHKQVLGVDCYEFIFYSYFVLVLPYCGDIWSTNVQNTRFDQHDPCLWLLVQTFITSDSWILCRVWFWSQFDHARQNILPQR